MTKRRVTQSSVLGPNQLVWDLGVDNIYDDDEVRERIKLVEEKFHLVMILEQFEVSSSSSCYITLCASQTTFRNP